MSTWTFRTPTVQEGLLAWGNDPLLMRLHLDQGITILNNSGTYSAVRFPTQDELAAATVYYMGGHEYVVDDATKAALEAANVGVSDSNFTLIS
jgi:hypothetical protein